MRHRARQYRSGGEGRGAFTFPELVLGMAITALCLGAMSSVMLAVSTGWRHQGAAQSTHLTNRQAVVRIQNLVRGAKLIGLVRAGSLATNTTDAACVMLWKSDGAGGAADRAIQVGEVAMLKHDRASGEMRYYAVSFPASMTPEQVAAANPTIVYSDLTDAGAPEDFAGVNHVGYQVVARNVVGATFHASRVLGQSGQMPTFEFQIKFERNGNASQVYGSAALRSPDFKPAG